MFDGSQYRANLAIAPGTDFVTPKMSGVKHGADFPIAHSLLSKRECTVSLHFPRRSKEGSKRNARECATNADPFDPNLGKSLQV